MITTREDAQAGALRAARHRRGFPTSAGSPGRYAPGRRLQGCAQPPTIVLPGMRRQAGTGRPPTAGGKGWRALGSRNHGVEIINHLLTITPATSITTDFRREGGYCIRVPVQADPAITTVADLIVGGVEASRIILMSLPIRGVGICEPCCQVAGGVFCIIVKMSKPPELQGDSAAVVEDDFASVEIHDRLLLRVRPDCLPDEINIRYTISQRKTFTQLFLELKC